MDIKQVENELNIQLPNHYVAFITNNKNDYQLLDGFVFADVEYLIAINKLIGFYGEEKSIKHRLIIGETGGGDFYLINLQDSSDQHVYYFDHEESFEQSYDETNDQWNSNSFEKYDHLNAYLDDIKLLFI